MNDLTNRHFLITGAASGIGQATARLLHSRGASLSLWDVNEPALRKTAADLAAHCAVVDVTDETAVTKALAQACAARGPLHGVVHCAGIIHTGAFSDVSAAAHRRVIGVNLVGSLLVAHAAVPYLRQTGGSLILLSSISAFYGPPEYASYAASKAGVLNLAQTLRLELEADGVHVGVVCPAFVNTPLLRTQQTRLFARFGVAHSADDVARAIVRGVRRRRFMIWPSANPALFHFLSKAAYPFGHLLMKSFWGKEETRR